MEAYVLHVLAVAGIYAVVALAYDLQLGYAGLLNFGINVPFAVGAYVVAVGNVRLGVDPAWLIGIAPVLGGCVMFAVAIPIVRRRIREWYLAVFTLAAGELVYRLLISVPEVTGGDSGISGIAPLRIGTVAVRGEGTYAVITWALAGLTFLAFRSLVRSRHGRALLALRHDPIAAASAGINVERYIVSVAVIGGIVVGLAGALDATYQRFVVPADFGSVMVINVLLMYYFGGPRTLWGPVLLGVPLIQLLPEVTGAFEDYRPIAQGILFIVIIVFMPAGLAPFLRNAVRAALGRLRDSAPRWAVNTGSGPRA